MVTLDYNARQSEKEREVLAISGSGAVLSLNEVCKKHRSMSDKASYFPPDNYKHL